MLIKLGLCQKSFLFLQLFTRAPACAKLLRTGDVNKVIVIVFEQLSISRLKISDTRDGCLSVGVIWPGHSTAATPAPHVPARPGPGPMGPERDTASRAAAVSVTNRASNEPSRTLKLVVLGLLRPREFSWLKVPAIAFRFKTLL